MQAGVRPERRSKWAMFVRLGERKLRSRKEASSGGESPGNYGVIFRTAWPRTLRKALTSKLGNK